MSWDVVISIARAVGIPALIFGSAYIFMLGQVWGQMSKKARLELVDPHAQAGGFAASSESYEWAEEHGFEWVGAFTFIAPFNPRTCLSCWRRDVDGIVMACYAMRGQTVYDFVTEYEGDCGLTTCSAAAGVLYPQAAGVYKQAFPGLGLDEVLTRHTAADEFLRARFMLRLAKPEPVEKLFVRGVAKTARRIWKIWFFPIRSFYWYSQMGRRVHMPVEKQAILAPVP